MNEVKDSQGELEQYGRRLCIRIDGVSMDEYETSNDVLQNVNRLLRKLVVKYQTSQSIERVELVKHTMIKHLG